MASLAEATSDAIDRAAAHLRDGGLVAFPTETVYGLGADTFRRSAIETVFVLKGRPIDNPLIAHVLDAEQAGVVTDAWDGRCDELAAAFWPGPLTLVLPRAARVPANAAGGRDTIAVRAPRHDVARRLLAAFGGPISAPSANRSGHVSPTSAGHVLAEFGESAALIILDGGECPVGIESTVLDLTSSTPTVLRPGSVTSSELRDVLGAVDTPHVQGQAAAPGTRPRHYAPRTSARMLDGKELPDALADCAASVVVLAFDARAVPTRHRVIVMPQGAGDYARRLYAALREADAGPEETIVIEAPPHGNDTWLAIHDRLRRATAEG